MHDAATPAQARRPPPTETTTLEHELRMEQAYEAMAQERRTAGKRRIVEVDDDDQRALSQESKTVIREFLA